jgi:hypothetical protein
MDELELVRSFRSDIGSPDVETREGSRREIEATLGGSASGGPRRRRRSLVLMLAALAVVAVALAVPSFGLGGRLADLFGLSNGQRVEPRHLLPEDRWLLARGGAFGFRSMRFLGSGGPIAYYAVVRKDGSTCFATGLIRSRPHISSLDCPTGRKPFAFPSRRTPLLDRSAFSVGPGASRWIFVLTGLAANGVARVGVVDAEGVIHSTPVVHNVYYTTNLPRGALLAIVALNPAGRVIYSLPLSGRAHAAEVRAAGEAGSVLIRFMAARVNRDNNTFVGLMTPELRRAVEGGRLDVPTWQVSNPCWYRYALLPPVEVTPETVTEPVRVYEHWWPGDVGGSPPQSFEQTVRLRAIDGRWLVDELGPATDERLEPGEPHGPHISACNLARN